MQAWLGRTQSAAVKGVLLCNGNPLPRTLVKLYDDDRGLLIALTLIDRTRAILFSSIQIRSFYVLFAYLNDFKYSLSENISSKITSKGNRIKVISLTKVIE